MARYLARRLAFGVFLVFAVSSASLLLASAAPGDYVTESFGAGVNAETAARARVRYGLDQTILEQYGGWLCGPRDSISAARWPTTARSPISFPSAPPTRRSSRPRPHRCPP